MTPFKRSQVFAAAFFKRQREKRRAGEEEKGKKKREKRGVWHFIYKRKIKGPKGAEKWRKNMDTNKTHLMSLTKLRILLVSMMLLMVFLVRPLRAQASETAEVKGTVQWTSTYGMSVPDSVTLYLLRDGTETGDTTTATKNGGWAFSFGQKPLRDGNGKAYTYSVKEDTNSLEEGYTAVSSEFNADNLGQKISMNSSSQTESSSYDYIVFYYKDNDGAWKKSPNIGGSIGGKSYIIPAKDFYIYWHTDSSSTYYGFKIDSIDATSDKSDLTFTNADALPNYTAVEKTGADYPETGHNYGNNEDKLWHYTAGATTAISISITNKGKYLAGGTWGTCPWTIDEAETLTIGAGAGTAVGGWAQNAPWKAYSDKIINIKTSGTVVLPQNSSYLFYGLKKVKSIDLSGFNTANVTDMSGMFQECSHLSSLDLSSFDTANVTNMYGMFGGCSSLPSLDLSNFNTANVTNMSSMFMYCSSLSSLNLSSFNTAKVTWMCSMFAGCSSLSSLDLSNFNTAKVTWMGSMFEGCSSLPSLDLSNFDTANVTNMQSMFSGCSSLPSLNLLNFNTANVTDMRGMFSGCSSLTSLDLSSFNTGKVEGMDNMFAGCSSLPSLDLSNFNTGSVTDMRYMFSGCSSLKSLDLSSFNTESVTNMSDMFRCCKSLTSLDLSSFNTKSATNMNSMFWSCLSLTSLNLSNFNTANVRDMSRMFSSCDSLKSIKLGAKSGLTNKTGGSSSFSNISPKAKKGEDITYTGKWTKASPYNHADSISRADLEAKYATNSSDFGNFEEATWVWEIEGQDPYGQKYSSDDGKTNGKHNVVSLASTVPAETQIDAFATDKEGNKTGYWTRLDDDTWTYTFYVYKAGVPWRVYEDTLSGYTGSYTKEHPLAIQSGKEESVITNVSDKVANQKHGSLKITKVLEAGSGTATEQKFSFEITLTDENKKPLSGNTMFGNTAFSSGKANVSVAAGESTTVSDIPAGYHYSVSEIPARGYRQVSFTNSSGTITDGTTEAVCTNKYIPERETDNPTSERVGLTINKVCDSQSDKFKFSINISNLNVGEAVAAEIKTTSTSASEKTTYMPDGSGEINAEAEISGSGSISLSGIPVGATYRITEAATPYIASYNITDAAGKGSINKTESANSEAQTPLSTMTEMADSGESISITFTNKKPSYPVSFTKRDEKDNFVENAVLEVSKTDGTKITSWTTEAGESRELSLEPGAYVLKELSAPAGYAKAPDISFTVDDTGKIFIGSTEVSDIEMIDNSTETTVSISKTDNLGFPVIGAGLVLTDTSTGKVADSWQTDNKPHDVKLSFGKTYTLSEVSVPNGYEKAQNITITVSSDGSLTVDGKKVSDTNVSMIDARKPYILPSTGGSGNRRAVLLLLSLSSLFALLLLSTKKGKKDSPEGD